MAEEKAAEHFAGTGNDRDCKVAGDRQRLVRRATMRRISSVARVLPNVRRADDAMAAEGRVVAISTHDVEFVAAAADRVIVMADGDVVAGGSTVDVVGASPAFAPQAY